MSRNQCGLKWDRPDQFYGEGSWVKWLYFGLSSRAPDGSNTYSAFLFVLGMPTKSNIFGLEPSALQSTDALPEASGLHLGYIYIFTFTFCIAMVVLLSVPQGGFGDLTGGATSPTSPESA